MWAASSQADGDRDPALQALGAPVFRARWVVARKSGRRRRSVCVGGHAASLVSTLWGSVFASVKGVGEVMQINGSVLGKHLAHSRLGEAVWGPPPGAPRNPHVVRAALPSCLLQGT